MIAFEGREPYESHEDLAMFDGRLGSEEVFVVYFFRSDRLTRGEYTVNADFDDGDKALKTRKKLLRTLIEQYGQPAKDKRRWNDDFHKGDPEQLGWALESGDVEFITTWHRADAEITLRLVDDSGMELKLEYCSPEHLGAQPSTPLSALL
ncbi:hypothetical protein [Agromyces sp. Leaf222]|uniref:hypothetical protein n=1 Tax=Agromyces sp. Leaf222 TaxID=1735688 RepID=UPI0006FFF69A|nr:hypothetical protein [Agromyces sp. Leaf222]KQM81281.1 hypothetical protein ASE68_15955 [Agromyces sp. Leaf222]